MYSPKKVYVPNSSRSILSDGINMPDILKAAVATIPTAGLLRINAKNTDIAIYSAIVGMAIKIMR